ncbi:MAG: hypothetical protein AB7P40_00295 [Chloroflexota bacterium]
MTVSLFAQYERQIPVVEAERMMSAAQAALYPHVDKNGAREMWNGWRQQIDRAARATRQRAGSLFVVDGKGVGVAGLKRWFRSALGRRAEVA